MNNSLNLEAGLANIQSTLYQMNESIKGLLLFQQFATTEINAIENEEGTSHKGTSNRGNQYGRLIKLEFLKFSGEDVQGWLYMIHQFFTIDHIEDDAHKIILESMHMFDKALNWHKQFVRSLFIGGLKDEINMAVRMFKPTKLTDVYCLAKMQEHAITMTKSRHAPLLHVPKTSIKYMPEHKCSGRVFSLEVIGTDVEEDDDLLLIREGVVYDFHSLVDEQPLISLNALSGVNTYKTMRVKGCVGKNVLHVLVDSCSTLNFLDLQIAKKLDPPSLGYSILEEVDERRKTVGVGVGQNRENRNLGSSVDTENLNEDPHSGYNKDIVVGDSMNHMDKKRSNRRCVPNIVEPEIRTIEEIVLMADRTMKELLQAPTEGYGEVIVIPEILAKFFEIKTNLLQLVQANKFYGFERDNPHTHISNFKRMTPTLKYRDVLNDAIKLMLFPYSLEGAARIWYEKEP
nr:reverse transcriptase domain-containing protein [Tanacetum cinerariifolium]